MSGGSKRTPAFLVELSPKPPSAVAHAAKCGAAHCMHWVRAYVRTRVWLWPPFCGVPNVNCERIVQVRPVVMVCAAFAAVIRRRSTRHPFTIALYIIRKVRAYAALCTCVRVCVCHPRRCNNIPCVRGRLPNCRRLIIVARGVSELHHHLHHHNHHGDGMHVFFAVVVMCVCVGISMLVRLYFALTHARSTSMPCLLISQTSNIFINP